MAKSLIEELPKIVEFGRKEAEKILESLSNGKRLVLQTNELVLPAKDFHGILLNDRRIICMNQADGLLPAQIFPF